MSVYCTNLIQAGIKGGMQVLMVPHPELNLEETRHATLTIDSLNSFSPQVCMRTL